jgi:uncharacterized protein (TIGR00369 family)
VGAAGYPPARHLLSDLGIEAESIAESDTVARIRATPHIVAADGGVRAGVLATLVDLVGGSEAIRAARPDRMVTADLTLQMVRPAVGPFVEARGRVVRRGRTTLVIEAGVFDVSGEGSQATADAGDAPPAAWATMTFAIHAGNQSKASGDEGPRLPARWSFTGAGLEGPVVDALSLSETGAGGGEVSMPVREYLLNSFGAVQGGVMALLGEVAALRAFEGAGGPGGAVVTDLQVAYLATGRVGPIVSRTRVLGTCGDGPGTGGSRWNAVVELFDEGDGGRLATVINVGAVSPGPPAEGPA